MKTHTLQCHPWRARSDEQPRRPQTLTPPNNCYLFFYSIFSFNSGNTQRDCNSDFQRFLLADKNPTIQDPPWELMGSEAARPTQAVSRLPPRSGGESRGKQVREVSLINKASHALPPALHVLGDWQKKMQISFHFLSSSEVRMSLSQPGSLT